MENILLILQDLVPVLLILVLVLLIPVLLIGVPVLSIRLIVGIIKGMARVSGVRDKGLYFVIPFFGICLAIFGSAVFSEFSARNLLLFLAGVALLGYVVIDEWQRSARMVQMRKGAAVRVQERAGEEAQYSVDMHRSVGVNHSTAGVALRCPHCGSRNFLPMGHAIKCAACGADISRTVLEHLDAARLARGEEPESSVTGGPVVAGAPSIGGVGQAPAATPAGAQAIMQSAASAASQSGAPSSVQSSTQQAPAASGVNTSLRQVHSVDGRAIWGDTSIVQFRCPRCGKPSIGYADRSRRCLGCGGTLTAANIVADSQGEASNPVDSAQAAASAAEGAEVAVRCPVCSATGTARLNRPYVCPCCLYSIDANDVASYVVPGMEGGR